MGNNFCSIQMDNFEDLMDVDSDASTEEFQNLQDESILGENYLILILRQLIQSREIQLIHSNYEDDQYQPTMRLPTIRRKPNLVNLKNSAVYQSIKQASGYTTDNNNTEENWSVLNMLANRQTGAGPKAGPFTQYDKCKINNMYIPNKSDRTIEKVGSKLFCGTFSKDGNYFVTASQDNKLRVFDASTAHYKRVNKISAKSVSWSILDIDFSPDGEYFVYSTWSDSLHLSKIHGTSEELQSLHLRPEASRFSIFSVAFSNCGNELLGGANDGCLYIYDRVLDKRTLKVPVIENHDDVNAVGFADETSNIFFSGGDDAIIKVWDRRTLNEAKAEPIGYLIGHFDGITYINSKNDGRHLISNSKDQSIKLWDLRALATDKDCEKYVKHYNKAFDWDYRWDPVPKQFYNPTKQMDRDTSVMTYRGHRVQKSLIRAKFSPVATTGQRYIYTGCSTGRVVIYDVLTGKMIHAIEGHSDMVRDVAWHPKRPEIISCAWDHNVNLNTFIDIIPEKTTSSRERQGATTRSNHNSNTRRAEDSNEGEDSESDPPLRRSKRIASRLNQSN